MPSYKTNGDSMRPRFTFPPTFYVEDIPSFVAGNSYALSFGAQWLRHAKTQLDSHTGSDITKVRLKRMFGPLFSELRGKLILEAGCGAGRFTEVLLEEKAIVDSFDISEAVLANSRNNGHDPLLRILRASIDNIPFEPEQFDIVFCPGVVQHTPKPAVSIIKLWEQVKPGGWLIFDQYRYNASSALRSGNLIRPILKHLRPDIAFKVTDALVDFWLPFHKTVKNHRFLEILLFRISPITSHYSGYPEFSESMQISWAKLNTHDNLTDFHKHHTTLKRLMKLLIQLKAMNQQYCVMPYTIEVRCQKPIGPEQSFSAKEISITDFRNTGIASG